MAYMIIIKKLKIVIFILFLCSPAIFGKELKLTDITVNGLSRTKTSTVLTITGLEIGINIDEDTADKVRQKLLEDEPVFWNDPGFGFRFYVDKVAIPALGANFTWDLQNKSFRVAISLGGSGN